MEELQRKILSNEKDAWGNFDFSEKFIDGICRKY